MDIPVTGDWSGDGKAKIGLYVGGVWSLDRNGNGIWDGPVTDQQHAFGAGTIGAVPVTGDWNGSGTDKAGLFVPATGQWYLDFNGNGVYDGAVTDRLYSFGGGIAGVVPITGDWSGSGTTKIGVFDPASGRWYLDTNGNGAWDGTPTDTLFVFGEGVPNAIPVTGDWTGTGTTKIGIYSNGTWYLDLNGNGVYDGTPTDARYVFGEGVPNAIPVTGDWTGTGTTKIGIYSNGTWYLDLNGNGVYDGTPTDAQYSFQVNQAIATSLLRMLMGLGR